MLAKSLLTGNGFRFINHPDSPPAHPFTPGYPVILLPSLIFGKERIIPLKIPSLIFAVLTLFFLQRYFLDIPYKKFYLFLVAFNPYIFSFSHQVMSEMSYLFFTLLALILCEKRNVSWKDSTSILFTLVFAVSLRQIGVTLFLSILIFSLWKKKKWLFLPLFLTFIFLTYLAWKDIFNSSSYISQVFHSPYAKTSLPISLPSFLKRIMNNFATYTTGFQRNYFLRIFSVLFVLLTIIGWIKNFKKNYPILSIYFFFYSLILLIWPWSGVRFLVPIIPFILYFFWVGLELFIRKRRLLWTGAITLLLVASLGKDIIEIKKVHTNFYPPEWKNYYKIAEWSKINLPKGSIVICRKPYLFYLWSGEKLRTLIYPFTEDKKEWEKVFQYDKPIYIIADSFGGTTDLYLNPYLKSSKNKFTLLYSTSQPKTYLYHYKD